jgi:hypothetical protein
MTRPISASEIDQVGIEASGGHEVRRTWIALDIDFVGPNCIDIECNRH